MTDLARLTALLDGWRVSYETQTGATWVRVVVKEVAGDPRMTGYPMAEATVVFEFERDGVFRTLGAYEC